MAFIFAASSVPGNQLPAPLWDKLVHLLVYAVLGVLFLIPLSGGRWSRVTLMTSTVAVILSLLYGISDEVHQSFIPDRSPDVIDILADTLGASTGVALVLVLRFVLERLQPEQVARR